MDIIKYINYLYNIKFKLMNLSKFTHQSTGFPELSWQVIFAPTQSIKNIKNKGKNNMLSFTKLTKM